MNEKEIVLDVGVYDKEIKLLSSLTKLNKVLDGCLIIHLKKLGISRADYVILNVLRGSGPMPMQQLGDYLKITSGTITYATNRVISRGLVKKTQHKEDRRTFYIELTKQGYETLERINKEHLPYISKIFGSLSNEDLDDITENIRKLDASVTKNR